MNDKKKLELIENKIKTILDARAKESEDLRQKIDAQERTLLAAENARTAAGESMDMDAFRAARLRKEDAADAIQLYKIRLQTIQNKEDITEKDSDAVIDELLQIQERQDIEYDKTAGRLWDELRQLTADYKTNNDRIEAALNAWHEKIKPNRRPCGVGSNHGDPTPVHPGGRATWLYKKMAFYANNYNYAVPFRANAESRY